MLQEGWKKCVPVGEEGVLINFSSPVTKPKSCNSLNEIGHKLMHIMSYCDQEPTVDGVSDKDILMFSSV